MQVVLKDGRTVDADAPIDREISHVVLTAEELRSGGWREELRKRVLPAVVPPPAPRARELVREVSDLAARLTRAIYEAESLGLPVYLALIARNPELGRHAAIDAAVLSPDHPSRSWPWPDRPAPAPGPTGA